MAANFGPDPARRRLREKTNNLRPALSRRARRTMLNLIPAEKRRRPVSGPRGGRVPGRPPLTRAHPTARSAALNPCAFRRRDGAGGAPVRVESDGPGLPFVPLYALRLGAHRLEHGPPC